MPKREEEEEKEDEEEEEEEKENLEINKNTAFKLWKKIILE